MAEWNEPVILPPVIRLRGIVNRFGPQVVHDGVDLDVKRGEVMGIVGGSGTGKSVLLRTIIGLNRPAEGTIEILGKSMLALGESERRQIEERWGVLFQNGALFSSLTVVENIEAPLKEHTRLPPDLRREIAELKIRLVGLAPEAGAKYPSELSGGMKKRAGLARALALDPEILFLDEPTAGLDPIGAAEFDELIQSLQQSLGLTVVMITRPGQPRGDLRPYRRAGGQEDQGRHSGGIAAGRSSVDQGVFPRAAGTCRRDWRHRAGTPTG